MITPTFVSGAVNYVSTGICLPVGVWLISGYQSLTFNTGSSTTGSYSQFGISIFNGSGTLNTSLLSYALPSGYTDGGINTPMATSIFNVYTGSCILQYVQYTKMNVNTTSTRNVGLNFIRIA